MEDIIHNNSTNQTTRCAWYVPKQLLYVKINLQIMPYLKWLTVNVTSTTYLYCICHTCLLHT